MAGIEEERSGCTATGATGTESYGLNNGRQLLHETGSRGVPDEEERYGLMEGNQHSSGEYEESAALEILESSRSSSERRRLLNKTERKRTKYKMWEYKPKY